MQVKQLQILAVSAWGRALVGPTLNATTLHKIEQGVKYCSPWAVAGGGSPVSDVLRRNPTRVALQKLKWRPKRSH